MLIRCKTCLTPCTRPRVKFIDGVCNACINWENKKKINWNERRKQLDQLCNKFRKNDGSYDVIVPGGGGKDSSYVAWKLKTEFKMNPLCVCVQPPLDTILGKKNLDNFVNSGFNVIEIKPNRMHTSKIAKNALIKYGNPQLDWLFAIHSAPIRISILFNIPFIMWGEEAESEYGGSDDYKNKTGFSIEQINNYYRSGIQLKDVCDSSSNDSDNFWLTLPSRDEFEKNKIFAAHWSFFELWDEHMHLEIAEKHCGLSKASENTSGAYNNFSHLDQTVYLLHMYLAYLKFGFGRATTDASIDIRSGKLSREQGLKYAKQFDHIFPHENLNSYLDYFNMKEADFFDVIEKFRNKEIFIKKNNEWILDE
tara:strand:- start:42 stop:1136 length:1095 start_codon:yes stop_codon:yes gene_type:complete